jgi:hypothetical protein
VNNVPNPTSMALAEVPVWPQTRRSHPFDVSYTALAAPGANAHMPLEAWPSAAEVTDAGGLKIASIVIGEYDGTPVVLVTENPQWLAALEEAARIAQARLAVALADAAVAGAA